MCQHQDIVYKLYEHLDWPTKPSDVRAVERFQSIKSFASKLFEEGIFSGIQGFSRARILDAMAASGIAGAAFAAALAEKGVSVELTVADTRLDELELVHEWLEYAGLSPVKVELVQADASALPRALAGKVFDLAIVWGSSLPHLDVYRFYLLLAGLHDLQPKHGVLVIEQASLLPRILVNNSFRHIMVEGGMLSIYRSYDDLRGVQQRILYKLPSLEYIGEISSRLWETAQVAAGLWLFYKKLVLKDYYSPATRRVSKVLIGLEPRETTPSWGELAAWVPA